MNLLLFSALVLIGMSTVSAGYHGLNPDFVAKIIETAQDQENIIMDEDSVKPVSGGGLGRATLNCANTGSATPTSVHALRPENIQVIGAIGDSLTAANGAKAKSIIGLLDECRGVSWCIGCESTLANSITLATIFKNFNPSLVGCSTATGGQNSSQANLNLADPGDTSFDMPGQARLLVSRLRSTVADADNKFKLINFFIGGNDLCDSCNDPLQTPENFLKNVRDTLDYFKANLPRTMVNLVLTLDVSGIEVLTGTTCRNMQNSFCSCGLSAPFRPTLLTLLNAYQKDVANLINSGRYDDSDLFTVVLHSFMTKMTPPKTIAGGPDYSYFAPDCFHFSVKGHEAAATELWNSMLTPHHQRADKWTIGSAIKCPSVMNPYLFTSKNSKSLKAMLSN